MSTGINICRYEMVVVISPISSKKMLSLCTGGRIASRMKMVIMETLFLKVLVRWMLLSLQCRFKLILRSSVDKLIVGF